MSKFLSWGQKSEVVTVHAMQAYKSNNMAPLILNLSNEMEVRGQSCPGHYTPGERVPATHSIGGWVGPIAVGMF